MQHISKIKILFCLIYQFHHCPCKFIVLREMCKIDVSLLKCHHDDPELSDMKKKVYQNTVLRE